jgi:IMP dehydrogenase
MHYIKEVLEEANRRHEAFTFDDVRLIPGYSKVLPDSVALNSRFSTNVPLKIPIVSAAMDTVTEYKMAIEMAKAGGLGIIHKNLSPKDQATQVGKVKHYLNGRIDKPIFVYEDESVEEVLNRREAKGYSFHSFPVLNSDGKLVGIVTGNDFSFCNEPRKIKEIMTSNPLTASTSTDINDTYALLLKSKKKILPLVNGKMEVVGMYTWSDVKRIVNGDLGIYNTDAKGRLIVGAAIGVRNDAFSRLEELVKEHVDVVVIDTSHAHSEGVIETLKSIKQQYPKLDVVAGNIVTADAVRALAEAGADGVKVGIGPGSICTTRIIAGVGTPQLSAIYRCAIEADKFGIPLCADGGLKNSGDIPIAIAGGADSVMMGSMLSGTDESPGDFVILDGRKWKRYRGMGSIGALKEKQGSRERYFQGDRKMKDLIPEGIAGLVPTRGKVADVLIQYAGGLKQGMGYVGAETIEQLKEKGEFDKITNAGLSESHPHDIIITEDAPNYTRRDSNA